ncbi:helix-turn-helix transcriptional regulator [Aerococcus urinaeequi]|uniref:Helix-turn-helix transcriptional regulator n=1 Tax=Aerococcus urinaeequi TaxID=51665 RepID=A0AAE9XS54_9LACT|nr:helix-turn-helix transcriptional regulator [Aerococcus urinaeequi]WCG38538.1 helix-turn-helix transcriptional regulator [Aerococcus urinaeequi]
MLRSNLSILLAERDLKISELYEMTGISKTTLLALSENKGKGVQFDTIDKICNALGVTPNEFFDYSPYIIELRDYEDRYNENMFLELFVSNKNYRKSFYMSYYFDNTSSSPVNTENEILLTCFLSDTDAYTDTEFFSIIDTMSIAFQKQLIESIKEKIIAFTQQKREFSYYSYQEKDHVPIRTGDKILAIVFENTPLMEIFEFSY